MNRMPPHPFERRPKPEEYTPWRASVAENERIDRLYALVACEHPHPLHLRVLLVELTERQRWLEARRIAVMLVAHKETLISARDLALLLGLTNRLQDCIEAAQALEALGAPAGTVSTMRGLALFRAGDVRATGHLLSALTAAHHDPILEGLAVSAAVQLHSYDLVAAVLAAYGDEAFDARETVHARKILMEQLIRVLVAHRLRPAEGANA